MSKQELTEAVKQAIAAAVVNGALVNVNHQAPVQTVDGKIVLPAKAKSFPMAEKAFSQVSRDVLQRADIKNLHFHDLRREANTRFIRASLTVEEHNIMLRHADRSMNAVYVGRNALLKEIQDKLDRYVSVAQQS